jgi:hypothetical protein
MISADKTLNASNFRVILRNSLTGGKEKSGDWEYYLEIPTSIILYYIIHKAKNCAL